MKRIIPGSQLLRAIAIASAIALAGAVTLASAQGSQGKGGQSAKRERNAAAPQPPSTVSPVIVQPKPEADKISPAKKAALHAEAKKRKAWQSYRNATVPTSAPGRGASGVTASEMAGNYPGLSKPPAR
ncbi:hypothetical protein [Phenylobacterium sp. J367]|uniref:hypothetical protein n=1 Tax=Phenylobacterium sp. J367 TaxID=2898435 RepID=UPI002151A193|nr:hypothetical protein [Phenylobacterium sp. J367]MCR5880803.1 hypothetical protein [Phenylobacterium sp. J367]